MNDELTLNGDVVEAALVTHYERDIGPNQPLHLEIHVTGTRWGGTERMLVSNMEYDFTLYGDDGRFSAYWCGRAVIIDATRHETLGNEFTLQSKGSVTKEWPAVPD